MISDSLLIENCLNGNSLAQRALFDKFAPKMLAVCMRYAKSKAQAEDILQDGFIKVFQKLNQFKDKGSLEGWIRRIMVNTALDQIRKEVKFKNDLPMDSVDYRLEGESFILETLIAEDLLKMINEMPDGYKTVFNLFAIEGFSHKEIAEKLQISPNTSKSQYSRARAFLKEKLVQLKIEE